MYCVCEPKPCGSFAVAGKTDEGEEQETDECPDCHMQWKGQVGMRSKRPGRGRDNVWFFQGALDLMSPAPALAAH